MSVDINKPIDPIVTACRFEVRSGLNGTDRNTWSSVADFDNGKDAADYVRTSKASYADSGKSLVIVKVETTTEPSVNWQDREQARLDDGTYTPLPGDWARQVKAYQPAHFAHIADCDKRKVAFTESASAGERDRQKVLSARAYADRHLTGMYDSERAAFVSAMLGADLSPLFTPLGDADALQSVYQECDGQDYVSSCMSHSDDSYDSPFHPVRVYAMGGDLTLAFLRAHDSDSEEGKTGDLNPSAAWDGEGAILARCLAWPEAKEFGRVYGSCDNSRALRTALEAQGYTSSNLEGAKFAKEHINGESYVVPYIDGNQRFSDCGDYFRIGGDLDASSTSGVSCLANMSECDRCGSDYNSDEEGSCIEVGRHDSQYWCDRCAERHSTYCDSEGITVADDCAVEYTASNGCTSHASQWGIDRGDVEVHLCHDGEYREEAFYCETCSESYALDDCAGEDSDGAPICTSCKEEADLNAAQLELELEDTATPETVAA